MQIETVKSRSDKYEECYAAYCQKKGWENFKPRNAEYVLLHTLSHMLIKEMSMQSGYSSSALHERIYSSENMCGILIYTGAADKEGSLGGLVELGEMNKFLPLLKGALENGLTCTTDPECFMKNVLVLYEHKEIESEINGCYEVIKFLAHLFRDEIKCFVERTEKALLIAKTKKFNLVGTLRNVQKEYAIVFTATEQIPSEKLLPVVFEKQKVHTLLQVITYWVNDNEYMIDFVLWQG